MYVCIHKVCFNSVETCIKGNPSIYMYKGPTNILPNGHLHFACILFTSTEHLFPLVPCGFLQVVVPLCINMFVFLNNSGCLSSQSMAEFLCPVLLTSSTFWKTMVITQIKPLTNHSECTLEGW